MHTRSSGKLPRIPVSTSKKSKNTKEETTSTSDQFETVINSPVFKPVFEEEEKPNINMANQLDIPMNQRRRVVPPTPGSAIATPNLEDDFSVKGHHLKMIQDS